MKYFIGVDIGGSTTKICGFKIDGKKLIEISEKKVQHKQLYIRK